MNDGQVDPDIVYPALRDIMSWDEKQVLSNIKDSESRFWYDKLFTEYRFYDGLFNRFYPTSESVSEEELENNMSTYLKNLWPYLSLSAKSCLRRNLKTLKRTR